LNQISGVEESDVCRVIIPEPIEELTVTISEPMPPDE
jgi:hypothetical protein